jgi:hypothetical protein
VFCYSQTLEWIKGETAKYPVSPSQQPVKILLSSLSRASSGSEARQLDNTARLFFVESSVLAPLNEVSSGVLKPPCYLSEHYPRLY